MVHSYFYKYNTSCMHISLYCRLFSSSYVSIWFFKSLTFADMQRIHYSVTHHTELHVAFTSPSFYCAVMQFTVGLKFLESTFNEPSFSYGLHLATMCTMRPKVRG